MSAQVSAMTKLIVSHLLA